ncbi:hypothetical protein B0F90DRAFT_1665278 [Multifurca ochricompacta]|uniref:CcmS related domain-containing protein n=1 Tax=Multifurca ochricompacta TaxID=376703 RepID=A0AAD4MAQ1_9AGAM|nr:hypothetical protein B0F90DRAFT_1665278 [Multifurca ochricompacta]
MPRPKKGKARAQPPAPEEAEEDTGLAPIPEDPSGYEGWDNYEQAGDVWPNEDEETQWVDGGANDYGYPHGEHWRQHPSPQAGAWDTPPAAQYSQHEWAAPTSSPQDTPAPAAVPAWATWGRNSQGAYGAPRAPRLAPQQQPVAAPPQATPQSRPRHDSSATVGATSWQTWGAEAAANGYQPLPLSPRTSGMSHGHQYRVAFASNDSYIPVSDRSEMTPHAQRLIFESIMNSRGGAPKQPQQRSARASARNSIHTVKQSKKSKREKRVQEQGTSNAWGSQQENAGWEQETSVWDRDEATWDQRDPGWGEGEEATWDQRGTGEAGRGDLDGEGHTDSDGWNDVTGRKNYRQTVSSAFVPGPTGDSPYPMPSRTMAYANGNGQDTLDVFSPGLSRRRNTIHDFADMQFLESGGVALKLVEKAFFGRERKARDRIHWQFPHDKDDRVRDALEWLYDNVHGIGAFGASISSFPEHSIFLTPVPQLNKFLQTRERGALFINASYDAPAGIGPALDWLTYEDVVETRDRLLQESVGFYDPAMQVIVFVLLPSKSGNSLAMWRRKVAVPNSVRLAHFREIELAKAALRKDYPVLVDEIRPPPYRLSSLQPRSSLPPPPPPPKKKKKRGFFRKLFRIFKIEW